MQVGIAASAAEPLAQPLTVAAGTNLHLNRAAIQTGEGHDADEEVTAISQRKRKNSGDDEPTTSKKLASSKPKGDADTLAAAIQRLERERDDGERQVALGDRRRDYNKVRRSLPK